MLHWLVFLPWLEKSIWRGNSDYFSQSFSNLFHPAKSSLTSHSVSFTGIYHVPWVVINVAKIISQIPPQSAMSCTSKYKIRFVVKAKCALLPADITHSMRTTRTLFYIGQICLLIYVVLLTSRLKIIVIQICTVTNPTIYNIWIYTIFISGIESL